MAKRSRPAKVHVVQGRPWKDALIKFLEPRSPYRPWHGPRQVSPGDAVLVVLDTDPRSVLAGVGLVGPDSGADRISVAINRARVKGLLELETLRVLADFVTSPNDQAVFDKRLREQIDVSFSDYNLSIADALFGHTSLAAARVLLDSGGTCTGCELPIDLTGTESRNQVHIHTAAETPAPTQVPHTVRNEPKISGTGVYSSASIKVQPRQYRRSFPDDWPAVLCDSCHDRFRHEGFTSFIDFRFSFNPQCASCSAQRSMWAKYGMPTGPTYEPWIVSMGCCKEPWQWICGSCGHKW